LILALRDSADEFERLLSKSSKFRITADNCGVREKIFGGHKPVP
jgi:hypothetical protein